MAAEETGLTEGQRRAVIRTLHALKSPVPDGSKYYQSGWDDGLEAAMEAVRSMPEESVR